MINTYKISDKVIIDYHKQKYKREINNINKVTLEYEVDLHVGLMCGNNRFISQDNIVCIATNEHRDYVL
jgi:hypothetical protein